jgi:hypothetical protein
MASTFEQAKIIYLGKFPRQINDASVITIIDIVLLGCAIGLFYGSKKAPNLKLVSWILLIFTAILFLWQLFSLS